MSGVVLVVDDVAQNRMLAEAQLAAAGYDVMVAASGTAALAALRQRPEIELVLLDVMMPGMDGFETCRQIRELPYGRELPVVFLTASHETALHQRALDSGADDFLRKPIERTELLLRVRSLVRVRKLQVQKALLTNLLIHDLKNPLAGIVSNTEFARDETTGAARAALDDVLSAADHLQCMVLNLLDIGRAEDGVLTPQLAPIAVNRIVESLLAHNRRRLESRRQHVEIGVADETVEADGELLTRALQNLLDNAIRHAPTGSVIQVELVTTEGHAQLRVRDEGAGVPVEARTRIFEKYGQAGGNERSSRGLGLLFCRLVAEAHRGRIWVEDNTPRGTTFVLELPRGNA